MAANLKVPFDPSCCDGGEYANDMSTQPCGCDKGAGWVCQRHQIGDPSSNLVPYSTVCYPNPKEEAKVKRFYTNPLEQHLHEVVNVTWNYAGRLEDFKDHAMNAVAGLAGEAGEVLDEHKKLFYHTPKDRLEGIKLELGDVCYYLAKVLELHGLSLEEVLAANKAKLFERHNVTD